MNVLDILPDDIHLEVKITHFIVFFSLLKPSSEVKPADWLLSFYSETAFALGIR